MGAIVARNIGLLLALALVGFLVWKHMQTAPTVAGISAAGFSAPDDVNYGNGMYQNLDLVAGNPNY